MRPRTFVTGTAAALVVCGGLGLLIGRGLSTTGQPAAISSSALVTAPSVSASVTVSPTSRVTAMDGDAPVSKPAASPTWIETSPTGSAGVSVPVVTAVAGAGAPRGLVPDPASVDRTDASAIAAAFAKTLLSVDPRVDQSPTTAAARAGVYASSDVAAQLVQAPVRSSGADWASLVAKDGFTVVDAAPAGLGERPADTAERAVRGVATTVTGLSGSGAKLWSRQHVLLVGLTRVGSGWVVTSWQYAD